MNGLSSLLTDSSDLLCCLSVRVYHTMNVLPGKALFLFCLPSLSENDMFSSYRESNKK